MASSWIIDAETSINSIIKKRVKDVLGTTYPGIFFTQDSALEFEPTFPTVYIHFLAGTEIGNDIEGLDINAILTTVQVEVTVNKEQGMNGARIVTSAVMDEFKRLGFSISASPEFVGNTVDTKRMVFRARRTIGSLDTFN